MDNNRGQGPVGDTARNTKRSLYTPIPTSAKTLCYTASQLRSGGENKIYEKHVPSTQQEFCDVPDI